MAMTIMVAPVAELATPDISAAGTHQWTPGQHVSA